MVSWTISKGERYLWYIKPLLDRCGNNNWFVCRPSDIAIKETHFYRRLG